MIYAAASHRLRATSRSRFASADTPSAPSERARASSVSDGAPAATEDHAIAEATAESQNEIPILFIIDADQKPNDFGGAALLETGSGRYRTT